MPKEVRYGQIRGPSIMTDEWPVAASVVFARRGGAFVIVDANNRLNRAGATDTAIIGGAKVGFGTGDTFTSSATAGQTRLEVNLSHMAVYRMLADADPANVRGETCDLVINSNRQEADIGASAIDIIQIVAADTDDDTVDVHLWTPNVTSRADA